MYQNERSGISLRAIVGGVLVAIVLIGGLLTYGAVTENIKPGFVGVVYDRTLHDPKFGSVDPKPRTGFQTMNPITQRMVQYPIGTRTVYLTKAATEGKKDDESFMLPTISGLPVNADVNFSYAVIPDKAPFLYTKFQGQGIDLIEQGFLRSNLKSLAMDIAGSYEPEALYGEKRSEAAGKVMKQAQVKFVEFGIDLQAFNFGEIRIEDAGVRKSITDKAQAKQAAEKAKADLERMQVENQQNVARAEAEGKQKLAAQKADAEGRLIQAKAEADSILAKANAQAEANRKLAESLTGPLLEQQRIQAGQAIGIEFAKNTKFYSLGGGNGGVQYYNPLDMMKTLGVQ